MKFYNFQFAIACGLLALIASFTAHADYSYGVTGTTDYTISYAEESGTQVVKFNGVMLPTSDMSGVDHVAHLIQPGESIRLEIDDSAGGLDGHFSHLGQVIRSACPKTASADQTARCVVTTQLDERCGSACIQLFMVGDVRRADMMTATFGFHQTSILGLIPLPGVFSNTLISYGVNPAWLKAHPDIFANQHDGTWLYAGQLAGSNIVTELFKEPWDQ